MICLKNVSGGIFIMNREIEVVSNLSAPERYKYFIKKVVDFEEVWGLNNDGWAVTQDEIGNKMIPIWPKREFAELCANGEWANYEAAIIDLDVFITDWLPGMKKEKVKPSIFMNDKDSAVVDVDKLLTDLEDELENY